MYAEYQWVPNDQITILIMLKIFPILKLYLNDSFEINVFLIDILKIN